MPVDILGDRAYGEAAESFSVDVAGTPAGVRIEDGSGGITMGRITVREGD